MGHGFPCPFSKIFREVKTVSVIEYCGYVFDYCKLFVCLTVIWVLGGTLDDDSLP